MNKAMTKCGKDKCQGKGGQLQPRGSSQCPKVKELNNTVPI